MGRDLETRPGISEGGVTFDSVLAPALRRDEGFELLHYVDPYGETVFNALQMPYLLRDLAKLRARTREAIDHRTIDRVAPLARRCSEVPHRYLVFIGD